MSDNMVPSSWTIEHMLQNRAVCREYLEKPDNYAKIPFLNNISNSEIPNASLVRFRGMIQDMLDPEFYLEKYTVSSGSGSRVQDGRYRDTIVYHNVRANTESECT